MAFESFAVSTAMPLVARDLDAIRGYGFAFSLFLTASLLGTVIAGRWSDARGPAWPAGTGLALFGSGLIVCGLATSFPMLLAGRACSGAGGGLIGVAVYVLIADVYPRAQQPRLISLMSAAWVLPGLIGPVLAGWLAETVSWRAVFLLVPPLTVPPAIALLPRLRNHRRPGQEVTPHPPAGREPGPVLGGTVLAGTVLAGPVLAGTVLAGAVLTLQWALARTASSSGAALAAATCLSLAAAIAVGLAFARLVPVGTVRLRRGLPAVVAIRGLYTAAFFGVEAFIPLMLVTQRGMSAVEAGVVLTGGALGWTVGSFIQARPGLRLPRHLLLVIGAAIMGISLAALVLAIRPPVPAWAALGLWAMAALGMGIGMASTTVLVLRLSEPGQEGRNTSGLQLSDALGGALGIALTSAAFAAWHRPGGSDATLFTGMWLACAVLALIAALSGVRARPLPPVITGPA